MIATLASAAAFPVAAAQAFNPQPDPPGKMLVSAHFAVRSIDVTLAATLRCHTTSARRSSLTVQIAGARFAALSVRKVACAYKSPSARRIGGSWSGELVGRCKGVSAVARLFVFDDARGGGDVELEVTSSVRACNVTTGKSDLLGKLSARMVHDVEN